MLFIDEEFGSLDHWLQYAARNPAVFDGGIADEICDRILQRGLTEPDTGRRVEPWEISSSSGNWREELVANGLNSRLRAVCACVKAVAGYRPAASLAIYAPEAVTPFARHAAALWPAFIGSEYLPTHEDRLRHPGIRHEDVTALSFADAGLDIVVTNEVLEHVPDIQAALVEIRRVLRPGGWHIGTFPFRFMDWEHQQRARLDAGGVTHLMEPEWHGNPTDPQGGSLVFTIPGWRVIDDARAAGFERVFMRFFASEEHGCLTENLGVFIFCAQTVRN